MRRLDSILELIPPEDRKPYRMSRVLALLCDDGDFLNGVETCHSILDCQAGDPVKLVEMVPVVLQSSSGSETFLGGPPASVGEVREGAPFVVEIWARQMIELASPPLLGLCCTFTDLSFPDSVLTCDSIAPSAYP